MSRSMARWLGLSMPLARLRSSHSLRRHSSGVSCGDCCAIRGTLMRGRQRPSRNLTGFSGNRCEVVHRGDEIDPHIPLADSPTHVPLLAELSGLRKCAMRPQCNGWELA